MTTIKSASTFILLIISLLKANSLGFIDSQALQKILDEIYFQPYPEFSKEALYHRFPEFDRWQPFSDKKIALQIGHLLEEKLPLELIYLGKDGGARVKRLREVELNKPVAEKVKTILESQGYKVEILTAILPPAYYSDVFVSLHSNYDKEIVSGFLVGTPHIDYSDNGDLLKTIIIDEYKKATGMKFIDYESTDMTRYYSFNWSKFKRAIHPKTPAVILEMGNMKNFNDLLMLTLGQDKIAEGIANGIMKFLNNDKAQMPNNKTDINDQMSKN